MKAFKYDLLGVFYTQTNLLVPHNVNILCEHKYFQIALTYHNLIGKKNISKKGKEKNITLHRGFEKKIERSPEIWIHKIQHRHHM